MTALDELTENTPSTSTWGEQPHGQEADSDKTADEESTTVVLKLEKTTVVRRPTIITSGEIELMATALKNAYSQSLGAGPAKKARASKLDILRYISLLLENTIPVREGDFVLTQPEVTIAARLSLSTPDHQSSSNDARCSWQDFANFLIQKIQGYDPNIRLLSQGDTSLLVFPASFAKMHKEAKRRFYHPRTDGVAGAPHRFSDDEQNSASKKTSKPSDEALLTQEAHQENRGTIHSTLDPQPREKADVPTMFLILTAYATQVEDRLIVPSSPYILRWRLRINHQEAIEGLHRLMVSDLISQIDGWKQICVHIDKVRQPVEEPNEACETDSVSADQSKRRRKHKASDEAISRNQASTDPSEAFSLFVEHAKTNKGRRIIRGPVRMLYTCLKIDQREAKTLLEKLMGDGRITQIDGWRLIAIHQDETVLQPEEQMVVDPDASIPTSQEASLAPIPASNGRSRRFVEPFITRDLQEPIVINTEGVLLPSGSTGHSVSCTTVLHEHGRIDALSALHTLHASMSTLTNLLVEKEAKE